MTDPLIIPGHSIEEFEELVRLMLHHEAMFYEAHQVDEILSKEYHAQQLEFIYGRLNRLMTNYEGYDNQYEIEFKIYKPNKNGKCNNPE